MRGVARQSRARRRRDELGGRIDRRNLGEGVGCNGAPATAPMAPITNDTTTAEATRRLQGVAFESCASGVESSTAGMVA